MPSPSLPARLWTNLVVLLIMLTATSAQAAVEVSFYSKDFGASFPHAFIRVKGTVDRTGEAVDASYGFTAKTISPAILLGSVAGEVVSSSPDYVAKSDRHFSLELTDDEYHLVMASVERWRRLKQPSYNLNRQNCVFFVADLARVLGMKAETPKALMKKPHSFLQSLARANRSWLHQRGADMPG